MNNFFKKTFNCQLYNRKVFTSLALFNMLISPLNSFPWVINGMVQAWVSLKRLQLYLNLENLNWLTYYTFNEIDANRDNACIDIRDGGFSWKNVPEENTMNDSSNEHNNLIIFDSQVESRGSTLKNINLNLLLFKNLTN